MLLFVIVGIVVLVVEILLYNTFIIFTDLELYLYPKFVLIFTSISTEEVEDSNLVITFISLVFKPIQNLSPVIYESNGTFCCEAFLIVLVISYLILSVK